MKKRDGFFTLIIVSGLFAIFFLIRVIPSPKHITQNVKTPAADTKPSLSPTTLQIQNKSGQNIINSKDVKIYTSDVGYSFTSVSNWYVREFGSLYPRNIEFIGISPKRMMSDDVALADAQITIEVSERPYQEFLEARSHYEQFSEETIIVDGVAGVKERGQSQSSEVNEGKKFVRVILPLKEGTIDIFADKKYEKEFNTLVASFKFSRE